MEDETADNTNFNDQPEISEFTEINNWSVNGGELRSYLLYVPSTHNADIPCPLMINLHGFGGNATDHSSVADMRHLAERDGCVLVYPQGLKLDDTDESSTHWNSSLPSEDNKSSVDDFAFINAVIGQMWSEYNVDLNRVYVCGFSNGAFFSYGFASFHDDVVAGIGSVAGTLLDDAYETKPESDVAMVNIHSLGDEVVSYEGNDVYPSVSRAISRYKEWTGIDEDVEPSITSEGIVTQHIYTNNTTGRNIEHYTFDNKSHDWDDTIKFQEKNTSELIWDYLVGQSYLGEQTQEEPIEEPAQEEPAEEEEVVEEPTEEEEVVEEPTEEEEVVEEPVNCCEDYDTSTWVTTDVDLGGGIINDKNGIGGKVTQTGKLCWNKVLYTDASLPTPYECPFESDDENDLWKNGGLVIDLKFNLTKDLELVFVASSGECYRGVISSTEPGPHTFTKISDQSSFDPDELKSQEDLQEIGDVELDDQPQNDSDDSNEPDDVDETLYVEDCECSVSFDGKTGSYVNVPYLEKPSNITVALYFKITSHDNLRVGDGDPTSQFLLFQQNSRTDVNNGSFYIKYQEQTDTQGKLVIGCASSEGTSVEISTSDNFITLNENYMIHATFGDDAVTLYVNGEEIDSKSKDFILDYHNEHTLHLGRKRAVGDDTDAFFVGNIYSFFVYAKELSSDYVKTLFETHKCE